jgi:hypothetical protein
LDEDTILAEEGNFGNVTTCPGGVIHVNLAHLSLKFLPEDFVRFTDLMSRARGKFETKRPRPDGKPKLQVVTNSQDDEDSGEDEDKNEE